MSSTGAAGPRGISFTDTMTLQATTLDDIGVYEIVMTIEQIPENGEGYSLPQPGVMTPITYAFTVTIDPCRIGKYEVDVEP